MKKTISIGCIFLLVMVAAFFGYQLLSEQYSTSDENKNQVEEDEGEDDAEDNKEEDADCLEENSEDDEEEDSDRVEENDGENDTQENAVALSGDNGAFESWGSLTTPTPEEDANTSSLPTGMSGTEPATDFYAYDWNGNTVYLSNYYGKPLVVNFWASWCGPCCSELPAFNQAYLDYGSQVTFMMVNLTDGYSETVEDVKYFVNAKGYSFPVYFDEDYDASYAYSIYSIPMTLFIDAEGRIIERHIGSMSQSTLYSYLQQYYGL